MNIVVVHKGDKGYQLTYPVTNNDGTAKDLTDYTVTLKVWSPGDPETMIVNAACTKSATPTDGLAYYLITANDFGVNNIRYQAEIELTKAGVIENTECFKIIVKESA